MLLKPPQKLPVCYGHFLLLVAIIVIFVAESYCVFINTFDAVCADSNLVCISSQVFHYLLWSAKRCFGIYIPFFVTNGLKYVFKNGIVFYLKFLLLLKPSQFV